MRLDKADSFFSPEFFAQLALVEAGNWWFRARNQVLLMVLSKHIQRFDTFLEIGCGTGFVLQAIRKAFPDADIFGSEYYEEGLFYAKSRVPSATFAQLDATVMSVDSTYDMIGAFDVLEHIEHDEVVIGNLARALKAGGGLLITVPQHRWLWSRMDEQACHVRRYTRSELINKVSSTGLMIVYTTSFVTLLLPLMWIIRKRKHKKSSDAMSEFRIPLLMNMILETIMRFEILLLKNGVKFRMGGSLLMLAIKK
jgi:SAM-dependent methyltransferase